MTTRPTTRLKLALVFTLILALALALAAHRLKSSHPHVPPPPPLRIEGRWKYVRASLGLPPLPDRVPSASSPPPSRPPILSRVSVPARFELRRKRSIEQQEVPARHLPPLFFAPDALERRSISLDEFLDSARSPTSS